MCYFFNQTNPAAAATSAAPAAVAAFVAAAAPATAAASVAAASTAAFATTGAIAPTRSSVTLFDPHTALPSSPTACDVNHTQQLP